MGRRGWIVLSFACALGLVAAPAFGHRQAATTTIVVTAGKPSEYKFALSKTSVLKGAVVFKVVNRGKVAHSFTILGRKTAVLAPGKSATLTVVIQDAGTYPFYSAVKGQAAKMKGVLHVTEPAAAPSATPTTPGIAGAGEPTVAPADAPCASPVNTSVNVQMIDFGFAVSQTTIPCGTVTFHITNTGQAAHTFDVQAIASNGSKAFQGGKTLLGGETDTETITFTRTGTYQYKCDIHGDEFGMSGSLAIT